MSNKINAQTWSTVTPTNATSRPAIWEGSGVYHDGEFRIWCWEFSSKRLWRSTDGLNWTYTDHNAEEHWIKETANHHLIKSAGNHVFYNQLGVFGTRLYVCEDGVTSSFSAQARISLVTKRRAGGCG